MSAARGRLRDRLYLLFWPAISGSAVRVSTATGLRRSSSERFSGEYRLTQLAEALVEPLQAARSMRSQRTLAARSLD